MANIKIPRYDQMFFSDDLQEFLENNAIICNPQELSNPRARLSMEARLITLGSLNEVFWAMQYDWSGSHIEYIYEWRRNEIKEKLPDIAVLKSMFANEGIFENDSESEDIQEEIISYLEDAERKLLYYALESQLDNNEIIHLFYLGKAKELAYDQEQEFERERERDRAYLDEEEEDFDVDAAIERNVRKHHNYSVYQWISNCFILDF